MFKGVSLGKRIALSITFFWFFGGGIAHFIVTDFFMSIMPPAIPFHAACVYVSGIFEVIGALALLLPRFRPHAGIGLALLTIAVTPANVYMWLNPQLYPTVPELALTLRLVWQAIFLVLMIWCTRKTAEFNPRKNPELNF